MKTLTKVFIFMMCITLLVLSFTTTAFADTPDTSSADSALLYCVDNELTIFEKQADIPLATDNFAKLMTGLIACEELADRLNENIVVTADMLNGAKSNKMGIVVEEKMPIKDLLYGLILCAYDDCATAISVIVSGDQNKFVAHMNSRASQLGLNSTLYTNPTGYSAISSSATYTTARDTAKLAYAASQNKLYLEISSSPKYKVAATNKSGEVNIYNRNYLVSNYREAKYFNSECRGLFAADMGKNKHGVATLATKGGANYICVVLSADVTQGKINSYTAASDLLKWAFKEFGYIEVVKKDEEICSIPVTMSDVVKKAGVCAQSSITMFIPSSDKNNVKISYRLNYKSLEAPITKGEQVGYLTVTYGAQTSTVKLITSDDIPGSEFLYTMGRITAISQSRVFKASIAAAIVLSIAAVLVDFYIRRLRDGYKYTKYPRKKRR